MTNTIQRLLLFFVAVPLLILAIVFLPHFHYAVLVALVAVFTGGGASELAGMFRQRDIPVSRPAFIAIGILVPLAFYLSTFLAPEGMALITAICASGMLALFSRFAFAGKARLAEALPQAAAYAFAFFYPGILGGFVILIISGQPMALESVLTFAAMVLGNDSIAWLVGITLGKKRGIVAVSPNKSLAGFIGGMAGSIGMALLAQLLFPAAFPVSPWLVLAFGVVMGAAVIVGDLFESALKRSSGAKDSGVGVPGRGGFLDSFDSELFSAPVFYIGVVVLGLFGK